MSSFIFGAGMLSTLHKSARLESSPDKLQNPKSFPEKGMALEQAHLSDGPHFVDGKEAQAECPRTQSPSVAGLRLSSSYLCSVQCFNRPTPLCGNVPSPLLSHRAHLSWSFPDTDRGLCLQSGFVSEGNISQKYLSLILPALSPPQVPCSLPEDPQLASGCQEGRMAKYYEPTNSFPSINASRESQEMRC